MSAPGLVDVVLDDLAHLRDTWSEEITESSLRRDAGVLRRLLVHKDLSRAWRLAGHRGEPRVVTGDLIARIGPGERRWVAWASNGGAQWRGDTVAGLRIGNTGRDADPGLMTLPLSRFADQVTIVAMGVAVKRTELIKYVANKLGGAHYDERRAADDHVFRALDEVSGVAKVCNLSLIFWELLATGQLLLRAPEIAAWLPDGGLPPFTFDTSKAWKPGDPPAGEKPVVTFVDEPSPDAMLLSIDNPRVESLMRELHDRRSRT